MLGSGIYIDDGLTLRGVNQYDGIWNLGLIEELIHHFPPDQPGFAGVPLKGYHFFFHIVVVITYLVTRIPITFLYFQIFPLIISFLWGLGVFKVVDELVKNKLAAIISVYFSFFCGSFAFILNLIGQKQASIDSGFGIAQPYSSALPNPAYASSVVIVVWSIFVFIKYLSSRKLKWAVWLIILSGIAVGFKAYAGMILMGGLAIASLIRIVFERKLDILVIFLCASVVAYLVFYPFNGDYGFLVYAPFLHIIKMIEGPFSFTRWDELFHIQRNIHNYFGMAKLFLLVFTIFLFGNIGARIIGIYGFIIAMKRQSFVLMSYLLTLLLVSLLIPVFFIQPTGGAFNIYQMHWYFLLLVSIFVGPGIIFLFKRKTSKKLIYVTIVSIFILSLPSSVNTFFSVTGKQTAVISREKLELLEVLSKHKSYNDTVLELPAIPSFQEKDLESWFWGNSNVIITALGKKRLYVANEAVPYPYDQRFQRYEVYYAFGRVTNTCSQESEIDCSKSLNDFIDLVTRENISIIYVANPNIMPKHPRLQLLTQNNVGKIYDVLPL
jgi:hypothetical protein